MAKSWVFCRVLQQSHHRGCTTDTGQNRQQADLHPVMALRSTLSSSSSSCDRKTRRRFMDTLAWKTTSVSPTNRFNHHGVRKEHTVSSQNRQIQTDKEHQMSHSKYRNTCRKGFFMTILEMTDMVIVITTGMVDGSDDSLRWSAESVAITCSLYQIKWLSFRLFLV